MFEQKQRGNQALASASVPHQKHYGPGLGMSIEHFHAVVVTNCHENMKIEDIGSTFIESDHVVSDY